MTHRARGCVLRVVALLATIVLAPSPAARADVEETERRLKLAGLGDETRRRVHAAIERGAASLLRTQGRDGAFRDGEGRGREPGAPYGKTALASLALAHTGLPRALDAARRGLAYLAPDGRPRTAIVSETYTAGLSALLVDALHGDAALARRIGAAIEAGIDPGSEWWSYRVGWAEGVDRGDPNLSTAQFAALGLWASERAGGEQHRSVWRRHLASLCRLQSDKGSWPYLPSRGAGYPNGTVMGLANLTLATAALEDELSDDPLLAGRAAAARRRALAALDRDGPLILEYDERLATMSYYGLYALEKACVFAEVQQVAGRRWYTAGAARLLDAQQADGGWGTSVQRARPAAAKDEVVEDDGRDDDLVSTSFALLFLLRASETYRPITPRDEVAAVITPGGDPPRRREPAQVPATPATAITPALADATIERLEALRRNSRVAANDLVRELGVVESALRAPPGEGWRQRAGQTLLAVYLDAASPRSERRNDDVAARAAQVLGGAGPSVAPALRARIDEMLRRAGEPPSRAALGEAFRALAKIGEEPSFDWLLGHATADPESARVRAARAALDALARWRGASGADRLGAVTALVRRFGPLERTATSSGVLSDDVAMHTARCHWEALGAPALDALGQLCAGPGGEAPRGADGAPLLNVAGYERWLAAHRDPQRAPW